MDIVLKQAKLAKTLFQIDDSLILDKIELFIHEVIRKESTVNEPVAIYEPTSLLALSKEPIPKKISAEQLIKEQNVSINKFNKALENIDESVFADENIEELFLLSR